MKHIIKECLAIEIVTRTPTMADPLGAKDKPNRYYFKIDDVTTNNMLVCAKITLNGRVEYSCSQDINKATHWPLNEYNNVKRISNALNCFVANSENKKFNVIKMTHSIETKKK